MTETKEALESLKWARSTEVLPSGRPLREITTESSQIHLQRRKISKSQVVQLQALFRLTQTRVFLKRSISAAIMTRLLGLKTTELRTQADR